MTSARFSEIHSYPYYWTDEQVQILLGCYKTATLDETARLVGRNQLSIKNKLHSLRVAGVIQGPRKSWTRSCVCKYCGVAFISTWPTRKYCSNAHKNLYGREQYFSRRPEMRREFAKRSRHKIRTAAMLHYGGDPPHCSCCGEGTIEFLAIDHIYNDGCKHRKTFKGTIEQWLKLHGYPEGFQVLCHNCNFAKSHYHGCPHKKNALEIVQIK